MDRERTDGPSLPGTLDQVTLVRMTECRSTMDSKNKALTPALRNEMLCFAKKTTASKRSLFACDLVLDDVRLFCLCLWWCSVLRVTVDDDQC